MLHAVNSNDPELSGTWEPSGSGSATVLAVLRRAGPVGVGTGNC